MATGQIVTGLGWYDPASGSLDSSKALMSTRPLPFSLPVLRVRLIQRLQALFERRLPKRASALLLRLVVGQGGSAEDLGKHQSLGISHLLAISGLHAFFVAYGIMLVLEIAVKSKRARLCLLGLALLGYAWLTGFRPPVIRAISAFLLLAQSRERGLNFSFAAAMALSALITMICSPEDLGSTSFCLSYLAAAGIAWLRPLLPTFENWLPRAFRPILLSLSVSTAALLAIAAFAMNEFGGVSPWSVLFTMFAMPFVLVFLAAGLVAPFLELLLPSLSTVLFVLLDQLMALYLTSLDYLARPPFSIWHPVSMPPETLVPVILLAGLSLAVILRSPRTFLVTSIVALLPFGLHWERDKTSCFRLLPVGHGQAALLLEGKHSLVVDCGDFTGGRLAFRLLLEALLRAGRSSIDDLVLTHGDSDHASSLPLLTKRFRIGRVWLPEAPASGKWIRLLHREKIPFRVLQPGSEVRPRPGLRILYAHTQGDLAGSNDGALAVFYRFENGPCILISGDQEEAGLQALLVHMKRSGLAGKNERLDLLVLPHHAAVTKRLLDFLESLEPGLCLASRSARKTLSPAFSKPGLARFRPWSTGESGELTVLRTREGNYRFLAEQGKRLMPLARHR